MIPNHLPRSCNEAPESGPLMQPLSKTEPYLKRIQQAHELALSQHEPARLYMIKS